MDEHEQQHQGGEQEPDTPEHEEEPGLHPRIWVGSLSDYNAGVLHGEWLDATQDTEELGQAIAAMLERSPTPGAEEWAILDYDDFGGLRLGEHEDLATVSLIAQGLAEHGFPFAAWANLCDLDREQLGRFDEAYLGDWDSLEAYAEHLLQELGYDELLDRVIPAHLKPYVRLDVEAFASDLLHAGEVRIVFAGTGGVWIYAGDLS